MDKKVSRPKEHTLGEVRYVTHYVEFPDGDVWCDQIHFFGPLSSWLAISIYQNNARLCTDLLRRGEARYRARTGAIHRLVIENIKRPRKWGRQPKTKGLIT